MDRAVFRRQLVEAAAITRDFARELIEERLPDAMTFRVHLNSSYDANAGPEFRRFPDDSSVENALETKDLDFDGVVDLLWRDGYVPQWVDLAVVGETGEATIVDVMSCGRFTDDDSRLYYASTGLGPFSPKGPTFPNDYVEGKRFSIYERSSCRSLGDLERVRANASKVWSLELHGPVFDDDVLRSSLAFPRLEILELYAVRLTGTGLAGLAGLPRLRHLRARLTTLDRLDFSGAPALDELRTLSLHFLPSKLSGVARLAAAAPRLTDLTLGSTVATEADAPLVVASVERLTLDLPDIPEWVVMPSALTWLTVRTASIGDDELRRVLARCPDSLESLGLRGTRASDGLVGALERFPKLRYVDAADTLITKEALARLGEGRPGFNCYPRLRPLPICSFEPGDGSILDADVEALVNPVNCVGVMGKGLALAFKRAYPEVFREYARACRAGEVVLGRVQVVETKAGSGPKYLINFPTKAHWRDKSRVEDIGAGLADLVTQVHARGIRSIAIPALGCGLGGLDWKDIGPAIAKAFAMARFERDVRVILFAPQQ